MKAQEKHTSTPWRIGDAGTGIFGPKRDAPSPEIVATRIKRANVEFIVKACNNHEKLLNAIKNALDVLNRVEVAEWENGGAEVLPQAEALREVLRDI